MVAEATRWEELTGLLREGLARAGSQLKLLFTAECVGRVLHLYEGRFPGEPRPRRAVEALRARATWAISGGELGNARRLAREAAGAARELAGVRAPLEAADPAAYAAALVAEAAAGTAEEACDYAVHAVKLAHPDGEEWRKERAWQASRLAALLREGVVAEAQPLERPPDYLYTIQGQAEYYGYEAGKASGNRQVLMGMYGPELIAIFFTAGGEVIDVERRALDPVPQGYVPSLYAPQLAPQVRAWQGELGFEPAPIRVRRFFVLKDGLHRGGQPWAEDGIGIQDYPELFAEVLKDPHESEEEKAETRESISEWEANGRFVLWWGNDYWLDSAGDVTDS